MISGHLGWQVVQTFDEAEKAIEYLTNVPVDVVITDIRMPGITGLDMIEQIKSVCEKVYFVVLSGYELFDYAQRSIDLGVKKFLVKPTSAREITQVLEKIEQELDITSFHNKRGAHYQGSSNLLVTRAEEFINLNYRSKFTLKDVADSLYVSSNYLSNLFKAQTGSRFSDYVTEVRLEKSIGYLQDVRYTVAQIAEMVGFSDYRYFSLVFKKKYNETPSEYRNRHGL